MKKVQYLALVLALTLGLVGGAYAAWTDQVVIDGRVSTGEMVVQWQDFYIRNPESGSHSPAELPKYVTAEAYIHSGDPQKAVIRIDNLYPTANSPSGASGVRSRVAVTGYAENRGTIPVKFSGAEVEITENENDVAEWMRVDLRVATRVNGQWQVLFYKEGIPLKDLAHAFEDAVNGTALRFGDLFGLGEETLYLYLDENAPNETQNSSLEFTIKLNFIQWNMLGVDTGNWND